MNAIALVTILKDHSVCPVCGNDKVGNGQGYIVCGDKKFKRGCKCGWEIEIGEDLVIISEKGNDKGGDL